MARVRRGREVTRDRESRLAEFHDCHQEYVETGNQDAIKRRFRAMRKGTDGDFRRANQRLAEVSAAEGADRQERLRRMKFKGWHRKDSP